MIRTPPKTRKAQRFTSNANFFNFLGSKPNHKHSKEIDEVVKGLKNVSNFNELIRQSKVSNTENDKLNRLELEIKLLKEELGLLKDFVHTNIKQGVKPVKSVENYTLKLKNKKKAEELIRIEQNKIDAPITLRRFWSEGINKAKEYLKNPEKFVPIKKGDRKTDKYGNTRWDKDKIMSVLIMYRERTIEAGYHELTAEVDDIIDKMDPDGLWSEPVHNWNW